MIASELAKILLENPDVEVVVRVFDDDIPFDVLSSDENIILLVEFPEPEQPEDTRMFV
jgi:hypothetical protein